MQKLHILNFILFCLNFKRLSIIIKKIFTKLIFSKDKINKKQLIKTLNKKKISISKFMIKENFSLFKETEIFTKSLKNQANKKLSKIKYDLGGGGAYNLLYFLTRLHKPKIILETGVAAGYSSSAFLEAINKNKIGKLFSSDFPYFRIPNPESFIGILVNEKYKKNWNLFLNGDEINMPKIKKILKNKIDFVHYDSDKSYIGKKKFFKQISNYLKKKTIIIIDDIQDDNFFLDYVKDNNKLFKIFKFKNKFLGLVYN